MTRAGRFAPLLALVAAGCLASKGDVALLQAAAARLGVQVPGAPGDAGGEGLVF